MVAANFTANNDSVIFQMEIYPRGYIMNGYNLKEVCAFLRIVTLSTQILVTLRVSISMADGTSTNQKELSGTMAVGNCPGFDDFVRRNWVQQAPQVLQDESLFICFEVSFMITLHHQQVLTTDRKESEIKQVTMKYNWTVCDLAQFTGTVGECFHSNFFPSNIQLPTFHLKLCPMNYVNEQLSKVSLNVCGYMRPVSSPSFDKSILLKHTIFSINAVFGGEVWKAIPYEHSYRSNSDSLCHGAFTVSLEDFAAGGDCTTILYEGMYIMP